MSRVQRAADRAADHLRDSAYGVGRKLRHFVAPSRPWTVSAGHLPPVLLLPGVYETWEFLHPIADRLAILGHPVHVVPGFGSNRGSIPQMAARAQRHLDALDLRDVVIVAHSKGGLIGKHMMVLDDTAGRIDRIIAINTPFSGSSLARYTVRRTLREFSPRAATISALAAERAADSRITSIYSESDPIIPGGSRLAGARNVPLPIFGHFRVLSSPLLFAALERELGHPTDDRPGHDGPVGRTTA